MTLPKCSKWFETWKKSIKIFSQYNQYVANHSQFSYYSKPYFCANHACLFYNKFKIKGGFSDDQDFLLFQRNWWLGLCKKIFYFYFPLSHLFACRSIVRTFSNLFLMSLLSMNAVFTPWIVQLYFKIILERHSHLAWYCARWAELRYQIYLFYFGKIQWTQRVGWILSTGGDEAFLALWDGARLNELTPLLRPINVLSPYVDNIQQTLLGIWNCWTCH